MTWVKMSMSPQSNPRNYNDQSLLSKSVKSYFCTASHPSQWLHCYQVAHLGLTGWLPVYQKPWRSIDGDRTADTPQTRKTILPLNNLAVWNLHFKSKILRLPYIVDFVQLKSNININFNFLILFYLKISD